MNGPGVDHRTSGPCVSGARRPEITGAWRVVTLLAISNCPLNVFESSRHRRVRWILSSP
jgi:hypothetical protein